MYAGPPALPRNSALLYFVLTLNLNLGFVRRQIPVASSDHHPREADHQNVHRNIPDIRTFGETHTMPSIDAHMWSSKQGSCTRDIRIVPQRRTLWYCSTPRMLK